MNSTAPVLEIVDALVESGPDLGCTASLSLCLRPHDCALIEFADPRQLATFADLCSGMLPLRSGHVRFLGYDWSGLPDEFAAALRGRIGRGFGTAFWLPFLDIETNILLPQLHHTRRRIDDLRREALTLANAFGLPGLPLGRPGEVADSDLARSALVRAFLGEPMLLLLEEPGDRELVSVTSALRNCVATACDRGAAVLWLASSHAFAMDQWLSTSYRMRLTDGGLVAPRDAA
jgi:phospholipid/cholesterol/gamma-HCH transport system ATP-binding protein